MGNKSNAATTDGGGRSTSSCVGAFGLDESPTSTAPEPPKSVPFMVANGSEYGDTTSTTMNAARSRQKMVRERVVSMARRSEIQNERQLSARFARKTAGI